jgi:hypothetical protein
MRKLWSKQSNSLAKGYKTKSASSLNSFFSLWEVVGPKDAAALLLLHAVRLASKKMNNRFCFIRMLFNRIVFKVIPSLQHLHSRKKTADYSNPL